MTKKRKPKLAQNSLELRNMTRHACPPPSFSFKDRKHALSKKACRQPVDTH